MFEKEVVDLVAGRSEVLAFQHRANVIGDHERRFLTQNLLDSIPSVFVAGVDQRELITHSQPGTGISRRDVFGHLHYVGHGPAIRPAGEQDHVGTERADTLNLLVRQAAVVRS